MQSTIPCKRCLLEDLPDEHMLRELILQRIALLPPQDRADGAEYARRLALCRACQQLLEGTCRLCGCYVEIRAAKRNMHCADMNHQW